MVTLSALVVARNEASQIAACLETLAFADEIVVVLDRSEDATRAVAEQHGARVFEGTWPVEGERRNFGIAQCRGAWVLEVDADERVPQALAAEIRAVVAGSADDWHLIPVDNWIGQRLVRHGWGAAIGKSAYAGLFRRGVKRWGDQRVHPRVELDGRQGPRLTERLTHLVDEDVSDLVRRFDRYTSARALDLVDSGERGSYARHVIRIPHRFWKCFVRRQGWREGVLGFVLATLAALYPLVSYAKACERRGWPDRRPGGAVSTEDTRPTRAR